MYPRCEAKLFCGEWWVFFYAKEGLSVLVEKKNTQLEAELAAAEKNVRIYSDMLAKEKHNEQPV